MKKNGFASADLTVGQLNAVVKKIGGHDAVLKFLRGELIIHERKAGEEIYSGIVNYDLTFAQMIQAGNYGWTNDDIVPEHFTIVGVGQEECRFVPVHLNRAATTEEALEEIAQRGLIPAKIEHLLSFGAKYPEKQREFAIVELGSVWVGSFGCRSVACLCEGDGRRGLGLCDASPDCQWSEVCRFLAVSR
jgi:hypothetical protein